MRLDQHAQDLVARLGFKRAATWIFHRRIAWYAWRGRIESAHVREKP